MSEIKLLLEQEVISVISDRPFFDSPLHDYTVNGDRIEWYGIFEESLELLQTMIPSHWQVIERKRNPSNGFLRVDIVYSPTIE